MEENFIRDNGCVQNNKGRMTDLVRHAINLDKHTIMNGTYVK